MPHMMEIATLLAERIPLPDAVIRLGIRSFISGVEREPDLLAAEFAQRMDSYAIAEHTETANTQHYEIPNEFFGLFLGPHRKYSSAFYLTGHESLAEAEALALTQTCSHAALADGQDILELGCGWGSLSLWMADQYPNARIVSVSNSTSQRLYIQDEAKRRGFTNLTVYLRHERFCPRQALRSDCLGGNVRAHGKLAPATGASAQLDETRGATVFTYLRAH